MLLHATVLTSHRAPLLERVTSGLCVKHKVLQGHTPIIGLLRCFLLCHRHPRGPEKHQPLFSHTKLLWRHCVHLSLETHKAAGAMSLWIKKKLKKCPSRMFSTATVKFSQLSLLQSVWSRPGGGVVQSGGGRTLEHLLWLVPFCDSGQALSSPHRTSVYPSVKWSPGKTP